MTDGQSSSSRARIMVWAFWILAFVAIPFWIQTDAPAWDLHIYLNALHSLQAGHDPYADGIAAQQLFHQRLALHPQDPPPYTYVYSPITLPVLRAAGALPAWLSGGLYWLLYIAGVLAAIWVSMQMMTMEERKYFQFIAPAMVFFPGLLVQDIILSGNVVSILYGLVFVTAFVGWRRNEWKWFYLTVLIASCFKAPLLSLLPIAIFSARKQWLPACATGVAGLALFAVQPLIWPELFRHYLQAVELQFSYNHDFGLSPAGVLGYALAHVGVPYSPVTTIFYVLYVLPLFGVLLYLSRQFLAGRFSLQQWVPVMTLGVIMLNPRIMIYDMLPIALFMALILWRFFAAGNSVARTITFSAATFVLANVVAMVLPVVHPLHGGDGMLFWKLVDGVLLIVIFAAGCWELLRPKTEAAA